ncbi:hypothetical protein [Demequina sp. SO4-13]|uniref:hypothetical protein n=1 Tax=Demequina sp. SO4-13 TaxID=3401027 RepID=UPI003AF9F7D5
MLINTFFIPAILAIVFSSLGIKRAAELERHGMVPVGRGAAIAGLVTGIVGVLNSLLWKWLVLFIF